ncbi:hypothetical protein PQX77_015637 [Marasmius sp. AFHP31]|nr:hypothetical protein PQX77_015637 [Marasmius sp. AFHP31]
MKLRVPPLTVNLIQACKTCFKDETKGHKLSKCLGCRAVAYCNVECQKADWKAHKQICNAIKSLGSNAEEKAELTDDIPDAATDDLQTVNEICRQIMLKEACLLTSHMKRGLTLEERNMLGWQPRCIGCSRTERLIRIEGAEGKTIKPCNVCEAAFYCCQEHWDVVRDKHVNEPVQDVPGNLSQCEINRQIRSDILFANIMSDAHEHQPEGIPSVFQWGPERHLSRWEPLKTGDKCWEEEFNAPLQREVVASLGPMPPQLFLRGATEGLSMPMTILFALQQLKPDGDWNRKSSLTIHLLGAHEKEVIHGLMFEEILHRLPQLNDLCLVMIGPEMARADPQLDHAPPCPNCVKDRKQRTYEIHAMPYHNYVEKQGAKYTNPDLAVAFNSGACDSVFPWAETMGVLVNKKVATVFTAYNREEAETESKLLRAAGANLVPALGPTRNPWGSLKLIPEPNRVTGFYATNGWLAGGFCG